MATGVDIRIDDPVIRIDNPDIKIDTRFVDNAATPMLVTISTRDAMTTIKGGPRASSR